MRVKQLALVGFKSFANKTTVHFEPGVTAIVGPNGSGKSNLVDAIRWVLGEHNPRDVRAPRLEDVIFNGTDTKAPLSMAEVTLTIEYAQGLLPIACTEVMITRRVYRSGESECFINQSPCRLKDVQELFLGTGLGGGTYAIIEQGHIDMILSSKPEERRVVFEEASGIAKYLAKKHETIRRLEEVEEHLVRIADIIGEVRRQVGALERAANKARQYKAQWEQLKQLELRLAVDELGAGQARRQQVEARLGELAAEQDALEAQRATHVQALEAGNAAVSAVQQRLQELRAAIVSCASQIEQHEGQRGLKARWVEELTQQRQQLEREEQQLRERLAQTDEQRARVSGGENELRQQLAASDAQAGAHGGELRELTAAIQAALAVVAPAKAELFEAATDASHQRNELAQVSSRLQVLDAQLARLEERAAQAAARREELVSRRDAAAREREALGAQHDEMHTRLTRTQHALDDAAARRHELTGRLHQLRDQVAAQRAQVALQEDLWRRHEGLSDAVKALTGQGIEGVIGPLADLVQAASGHEEVVEAALGPLAEAVVVTDRAALARCRDALTAHQLESCRFLVLADCPAAVALEPVAALDGVSKAVREVVTAEPQYQPLVNWLLNDSWLVDDIQRLLGAREMPNARLVSPRGDRWDRRSWRFGASRRAAHPPACAARHGGEHLCTCGSAAGRRFGRKQRWEQARMVLQAMEEELVRLQAEVAEADQAWQTQLGEQESARGALAQATPGLHKLESQAAQLAHEVKRLDEERRMRELELAELTSQRNELRERSARLHQAAEHAQQRQQTLEASLAQHQAAHDEASARRQELAIAGAQMEATRQSLADRLGALEARMRELDADRTHLRQQHDARAAQREDAAARLAQLAQQIEEHQQAVQRLQDERSRLEPDAETVSQAVRAEEAKRDQVVPHLLAVEQQLSALMQQLQEQQQQLAERTYRRSHLVERLRELYQIDEATIEAEQQANPAPLSDEQRTAMTEQVQQLRGKLEGIGPVSLGSVEEYDELKRRLEFLQSQQQDLVASRDDLKASIAQINRTARAQFRETFEKIRQEFQHYFGRLFNGGEATLILMDEEDVLESGIDIVARPPGKRLQSISLLSGGERALTAVALLFALFKVRPSPFCILDEIDAPLDEANVDRFTRVLEEFLSLSQFILVTHNKKTITKADCLYGVTMEEPGISKILSAKLTAAEPPAPVPA